MLSLALGLGARSVVGEIVFPPADPIFSSVMFPPENGVQSSTTTSGQIRLTDSRTAMVGTASTDAALWNGASSVMMLVELDREAIDTRNIRCNLYGTHAVAYGASTQSRSAGLQYSSLSQGTAGERGRFYLYFRGETGANAWIMPSPVIPAAARGPFIALGWNDGTNGYLSIYDIPTATWYDGSAVAKPASWGGVSQLTNDIVIGGDGATNLPAVTDRVLLGGFRDLIFADVAMTKANAISIQQGADIETTLGGSGNLRLHIPGAVDGAVSTAKNGTRASTVTVTQQGAVRAGPTLRRQGATNYMTIDRRAPVFGVSPGTTTALVQLSGTHGGTATGNLQIRQVGEGSGTVYKNWTTVTNTGSAGVWQCQTTLNEATERCDIQARFSGAPDLIATTGPRHWVKPVVIMHGQSEGEISIFSANTARQLGTASTLNVPLNGTAGRVSFGVRSFFNAYGMVRSDIRAGYLGDEAVAIANIISPIRAAHIVVNCIGGTSMAALMNDAATSRQWQDTLDRLRCVGNLDADGAIPVFAHVIVGWESAYSGVDGVMRGWYKPFLTGEPSTDVPSGDLDHWLFNGELSDGAPVIVLPANRASTVNAAGASATDASAEANQRDQMRNYSHIYNYLVGPEQTTHKLEGENAASGALVINTHPEADDYQGDVEMAVFNAEAIKMGLGSGVYPGPAFFETITAGSAADKVRVQLGLPRPNPGDGLAEDATGYSTAAQSGSFTYALHTKLTTGNAGAGFEARIDGGAWSKANVTSGTIVNAATGLVELTLASTPTTSVEIRYHPGTPGAYSTATITQANWRAGALFFTGTALASAPASVADVQSLGFAVAGSNQSLVLTL